MLHSDVISALVPNGDVAADSYHRYKEDVKAARDLKLQMYRFSLSWPRLLPTGHRSSLNPDGIRYYTDLLNELHSSGIKPMVTLVHFDHPVALQKEFGGWDDDRMIDAFVEYADIAFTYFGDKVQYWVTFNEPYVFCGAAGQMEFLAKAIVGVGVDPDGPVLPFGNRKTEPGADYNCLHRMILAHARVYRLYKEKFASSQKGRIGIVNISYAARPNSTRYEDVAAARRYNLFTLGTTFGPLVTGQYPDEVRNVVDEASRLEGRATSRLPVFTPEQSALVNGTIDFLGVNQYNGQVVADTRRPDYGSLQTDAAVDVLVNSLTGPRKDVEKTFTKMTPWSIREAVLWLWDEYRVPIFITENGYAKENKDKEGALDDHLRAVYHSAYLRELMFAINEEGVHVIGYLAWSLIDLYEWLSQYRYTFGLVHVDYAGGSLNRTLKRESSAFFIELAETRKVPVVPSGGQRLSAPAAVAIVSVAAVLMWPSVLFYV
ncbi:myrosinase 1-like [Frankliniella occidentalis]|uniref:Myrosinase 1-like n=1 Tax=Frankliniella occidentalis TaxID=133901 RepID=A0A9C6XUA7_FRAOC|nr:myrosinase 1-like [Frankliniella occidentalis]